MSAPTSPVITFQVCLEPTDTLGMNPFRYQSNGDRDLTEQANIKNTRIWSDGIRFTGRSLKHGERFTLYGLEAQRTKDLYVNATGAPTCDKPLLLISEDSADALDARNIGVPNGEVGGPGGTLTASNDTLGAGALPVATDSIESNTGQRTTLSSDIANLIANAGQLILDARVPSTTMAKLDLAAPSTGEALGYWGDRRSAGALGYGNPINVRGYAYGFDPPGILSQPTYVSSGLGTGPRVNFDAAFEFLFMIPFQFIDDLDPTPTNVNFGTKDPFLRPSSFTAIMVTGNYVNATPSSPVPIFRATDPENVFGAVEWGVNFGTNGKITVSFNAGAVVMPGGGIPSGGADLVVVTHDGNTNITKLYVNGPQVGSSNIPIPDLNPTVPQCASAIGHGNGSSEFDIGYVALLGDVVLTQAQISDFATSESLTDWGVTF